MNIKNKIKDFVKFLLPADAIISNIVLNIQEAGGVSYLVGGSVRDILMADFSHNINIKDLDIEVHGLDLEALKKILSKYGHVNLVGKSFGVLRVANLDVDWSLPRTDSSGRKPEVKIDPNMDITTALKRRDLTINSMAINLNNYELIDPYGGINDIKNKVLRATDSKFFGEDPLRFFRVMQFVSRFELVPDNELNQICANMDVKSVSKERIELEFEKMLLKSKKPSLGLRWLLEINRLEDIFPELYKTVGVKQEFKWHPEKDVFEHTMQALDAEAKIYLQFSENPDKKKEKLILLYAAICHDLGKPDTTEIIDGVIKSHGHEVVGVEIANKFLRRITDKKEIIDPVLKLVRNHMAPGTFAAQNASPRAYKRLALHLSPDVNIKMLANLAFADRRGRNPDSHEPLDSDLPEIQEFLNRAEQAQVLFEKEQPILLGRDFLDIFSGPQLGEAVRLAYKLQIDDSIKDKEELRALVIEKLREK